MADDPQDPIRAKKRARWNELRKQNRDVPADSVTAMVEREFAASPAEAPAIDERVLDRSPLAIQRPAQASTGQQSVDRSIRARPEPSGVSPTGQGVLAAFDAINPFNDELAGLVSAGTQYLREGAPGGPLYPIVSPAVSQAYTSTRDAARAPVNEFAYDHPIAKTGMDIAGGLVTPPLFGPAKAGLGPLRRIAGAAGRGAAEGAVYGFGSAEGSMEDQSIRALLGAGTGAAVAGGTQTIGNLAFRDPAGDVMARSAVAQGDAPIETVLQGVARGTSDPAVTGMEAMGRTGRDLGTRVARQGGAPARQVTEAAEAVAAEGPPRLVQDTESAFGVERRDPVALADELAQQTQRDAQPAIREARAKASQTLGGAPQRVADRLEDAVGVLRKDAAEVDDALIQQRTEASTPLYEAAEASKARLSLDMRGSRTNRPIRNILATEPFRKAYAQAERIAALEGGKGLPKIYDVRTGEVVRAPDIRTVNLIKKGLDKVIEIGTRSGDEAAAISKAEMETIRRLKNDLLDAADLAEPLFGEARRAYAGPSELRNQLAAGREGAGRNVTAEQIATTLRDLSPSEAEAWRTGYLHEQVQKIRRTAPGSDPTKALMPQSERLKLRAVIGDERRYQDFLSGLEQEHRAVVNAKEGLRTAKKVEPSGPEHALHLGRRAFASDLPADELASRMAEMSPAETQRVKQGALADLAGQLEASRSPAFLLNRVDIQRKLRSLVGDEAAGQLGELARSVTTRQEMATLLRRLTDSPSTVGSDAGLANAAGNLAAGQPNRAAGNFVTRGLNRITETAVPEDLPLRTRERLAQGLSARGPAAAAQADASLVRRKRLGRSVDVSSLFGRVAGREVPE